MLTLLKTDVLHTEGYGDRYTAYGHLITKATLILESFLTKTSYYFMWTVILYCLISSKQYRSTCTFKRVFFFSFSSLTFHMRVSLGGRRQVLFRNPSLSWLPVVAASLVCIMINLAQVPPPPRQARMDALRAKVIHQQTESGILESVPDTRHAEGRVPTTPISMTPQEINVNQSRSM